MRREKAAAESPEPRPDLFTVRLWNVQRTDLLPQIKSEPPLDMNRRQYFESGFHFKQKHQPVRLALIPMFADQTSQVQIRRTDL